ncbi:MAG: CotH kinase family protein [Spirochaetaceae bacterium]|nr:CotH kinase family protein [Spirochaetaceae bacterium]
MKLNFTKKFLTVLLCFMTVLGMMFLVSCGDKTGGDVNDSGGSSNESGSGSTGDNDVLPEKLQLDDSKSVIKSESPNTVTSSIISEEDLSQLYTEKFTEELNPEYDSRTESLDNIFNPDALGQMVLVFDRSEWDKHLSYCDLNMNHEESVVAKGFYFTKDNKEWYFNDIGFRIRGNTSRRRPQLGNGKGNNDYVQAHFALDFEEWTDEDKKLADCMKGVILKRFKDDATYSREVYAYNLFRQNGIWIAPRAAYTRLIIQIQESDGTFETVDYGVYSMIEEIKKQFLKERTTETGGYLSSNKGNLWKCLYKVSGSDFVYNNANSIGEEKIEAIEDDSGNITGFSIQNFDYDYKGDNDLEEDGKPQILAFMEELNNLPNCTDGVNDSADKEKITKFYNEKMAGDLFLRTYAINVVLGMWDDYWINNNNFYFYFDEDGKAYFIPYDYDNSLGVCHLGVDAGKANPYTWGDLTDGKHPLIQKILQVPEYMKLYQKYLLEYSNENSFFDDDKSIARIKKWHSMIGPYIFSKNLVYSDTTTEFIDKPAGWGDSYKDYTIYTPGEMNYFTVRQKSIKDAKLPTLETTGLVLTLDAGDGYFWTGNGDGTHKLYCSFKSGDTFSNILSAGGFKGWTVWLNDDGLKYGYEKEGRYYWPDWFCDANGDSVSNSTKFYESETIYTNWVDFTDVVVPYCFEDWETITFTYNPEHFDSDVVGSYSENAEVYLMFPGSNWQPNEYYKLTRQNTGIYTKTFNWEQDIKPGFDSWNGYKFFIKEGEKDNWLGADVYSFELPDIYAEPDGDRNFRLVY